jgi:hypothetical protein
MMLGMPKSRGRPKGRGRPVGRTRPIASAPLAAVALRDASQITAGVDSLNAETWASGALGSAWETAGIMDREPEASFCRDVARRAVAHPSPQGLAAVAALRRLVGVAERHEIDEAFDVLSRNQPRPDWIDDPPPAPTAGWRAVDPWGSRSALFVEYADPRPYTLMAGILEATGSTVQTLRILRAGAAQSWPGESGIEVPMPVVAMPASDVLAELAVALERTDRTIPRPDDESFVALRALAWSRCRAYQATERTWEDMPPEERERLIAAYIAESGQPDTATIRFLAGLFLDYGVNYITTDALAWSPDRVWLFLADWLPRKAILDADDRRELPEALRRWVRFALRRRGVEERWVEPVVAAVDEHLAEFEDAFGDPAASGPAKALAVELKRRGVDLSDDAATEDAISALNAENLARRIINDRK